MGQEYELSKVKVKGVGKATINKLAKEGITTLKQVLDLGLDELARKVGEKRARELYKEALRKLNLMPMSALDYYKRRKTIPRLTTGCKALDKLLGGGIEVGSLVEFYGEFGTGKTQICHQLSITAQLPRSRRGLEGSVLYIDTEGTFRPERIVEIASKKFRMNERQIEDILANVNYVHVLNSDHQLMVADEIPMYVENSEKPLKLVIVDSIIAHFRAEYPGRENLPTRQSKINQYIRKLMKYALMYDLAIVVTNQIVSRPDVFFGDPTMPVGGNVLAHIVTHRIALRKVREGKRVAKVIDSPNLPPNEVMFVITDRGIEDVEE